MGVLAPPLAVTALGSVDVSSCDALGLRSVRRLLSEVDAWTASLRTAVIRRDKELNVDPRRGLEADAAMSARAAREAIARTEVLDAAPGFESALQQGSISEAHVDALGKATKAVPGLLDVVDALLVTAERVTPAEFATHCERVGALMTTEADDDERFAQQQRDARVRRWIDKHTGMYRMSGAFDPETGDKLWAALDRQVEAIFHGPPVATLPTDPTEKNDHFQAIALANMVLSNDTQVVGVGTRQPEIRVHIDLDTLLHGKHETSICELTSGGHLPVSRVRQLACEANLIPIVFDGNGVALDVGRSKRLATPDQRRALEAMYPTCGLMPGCDVPFAHTQIHHLREWDAHHGHTDLKDLIPACTQHHTDTHTGRITVDMDPTTRAVTRPRPLRHHRGAERRTTRTHPEGTTMT